MTVASRIKERWRDIPGYEGRYQVSDRGRVRSLDHYVRVVARGTEAKRKSPGKILRPGLCNVQGHVSVALGRGNSIGVHTLVMLAFKGPRPLGYDAAHKNGKGGDNRFSNLAYKTRADNNRDAMFHGRRKLNLNQVKQIKRAKTHAETCVLAKRFKVSSSFAYNIMRNLTRAYTHVVP